MTARPLALALAFAALGYASVYWWWPPGATAGAALCLGLVGERLLAPLSADERRAWPGRPPLGLDVLGLREGLRVTLQVLRWAAPITLLLLVLGALYVRVAGVTEARLDAGRLDFRSLDALPDFLWRACVVAPLVEELVWRGLCQQHLARALGPRAAIFLSGVLFWVMHWIPAGSVTAVNQLAGGWVIAWSWQRTRGLVAPVLLHAIGNATIAALLSLWIVRPEWLRDLLGF